MALGAGSGVKADKPANSAVDQVLAFDHLVVFADQPVDDERVKIGNVRFGFRLKVKRIEHALWVGMIGAAANVVWSAEEDTNADRAAD